MGKVKYSTKIIDNKEIIFREFFGDMNINEMIESFKYISKYILTEKSIGIITDTREARIKVMFPELSKVFTYLMRNKKIRKLKLAIIVNTPENTIFPMIAKSKLPLIKVNAFNGYDAAVKWVME